MIAQGKITRISNSLMYIDNTEEFWRGSMTIARAGIKIVPKVGMHVWADYDIGGLVKHIKIDGKKQF